MKAVSSLGNRVFLACAFVAVLSIAVGTHFVTARVSREAEAALARDLAEAAELVEQHYRARSETSSLMAFLLADLPKLKAAVATGDGPTVEPLARDYRDQVGTDVFVITDGEGRVLAAVGDVEPVVGAGALERAREGDRSAYTVDSDAGVLEMVTLPITIGPEPPEVLGTLSLGFFLGDELARELRAVTQSEIALVAGGRVVASTVSVDGAALGEPRASAPFRISSAEDELVALWRALPSGPEALVMRSRSERLAFLSTFREGVLLSALIGVLLATVLSYAVARTVTRPLRVITETIREITTTGDLTRKIELEGKLVDEDATMLASAFNRLTEAIARFQREAASRERLSALGRMSTVIAHEIRNPLMIIKASLRELRRDELSEKEVREAAEDIDHEVARLNRMVGDVLDFARPIRLDLHPTDVNAVCRDAVEGAYVDDAGLALDMCLDTTLPEIVTDGERLRAALVNILANARDAVGSVERRGDGGVADVELETVGLPGDRIRIVVRDRGPGIAAEDLPKIFEPYFTGKRTGTGLGLAITKNIVESLGGTVSASSDASTGTEIAIELYARRAEAPSASRVAVGMP